MNTLNELWKIGSGEPSPSSLVEGGLAIDTANKSAYSKGADGSIFKIGGNGGNGVDFTSNINPSITTNPANTGSVWVNSVTGEIFVCIDITTDNNIWKGTKGTSVQPHPAFDIFKDNSCVSYVRLDSNIVDDGGAYTIFERATTYASGKIADCLVSSGTASVIKITGSMRSVSFFAFFPSTVASNGYLFDCRSGYSAYCYLSADVAIAGSAGCTIYVNGATVSQFPKNQWCYVTVNFNANVPLIRLLNHESDTSGYGVANVKIDNVRCFNRVVTLAEMTTLSQEV